LSAWTGYAIVSVVDARIVAVIVVVAGCGPSAADAEVVGSTATSSDAAATGSSATEASTTSTGDASSSTSDASTGSSDECSGFVGQVTPEQVDTTPRPNAEAEWLAIEITGEVVAPQPQYDEVVAELAAIRALEPALEGIVALRNDDSTLLVQFDEQTLPVAEAGEYSAWDCVNELYRATPGEVALEFVPVIIPGRFRPDAVLLDYAMLPGVKKVDQLAPPSGDIRDVCAEQSGAGRLYVFREFPHCPNMDGCFVDHYWGFASENGAIEPLGEFDRTTDPTPTWFSDAVECGQ
jgi:hypothetical protein